VEVGKEKRWVFEQSMEVDKNIIVSEMNCGSSNKKKSWVLSKDIKIVMKCGSCKRKKMGI